VTCSKDRYVWFLASLVFFCLSGNLYGDDGKPQNSVDAKKANANPDKTAAKQMDGFDCGSGKAGWKRSKAITPNLVPPCNTGSGGVCEQFFEYVPGTGWCRPR
jgi:hypothetical protein